MRSQLVVPAFATFLLAACASGAGSSIPANNTEKQIIHYMESYNYEIIKILDKENYLFKKKIYF